MTRKSAMMLTLICAAAALIVLPSLPGWLGRPSASSPETTAKQAILQQDTARTEQLARLQCTAALRRAMSQVGMRGQTAQTEAALAGLKRELPHIVHAAWISGGSDSASGRQRSLAAGDAAAQAEKLPETVRQQLKLAQRAVLAGRSYESPSTRGRGANGHVVIALPAARPLKGGAVVVMKHQLDDDIIAHQQQNLRLVPYPAEGRFSIESVDTNTHRDISVDNGEENGRASHYYKRQAVVKFKTAQAAEALSKLAAEIDGAVLKSYGSIVIFESKSLDAKTLIAHFQAMDIVQFAEPHYLYMTNEAAPNEPNDVLFESYQWNLPITGTLEGWELSKGSGETLIAVLDTGVDLDHPDLRERLAAGLNLVEPEAKPYDDVGHGTHVAGIIAASVNNAEGIAGMTWYGQVMPVKVLDATGAGSAYSVAQGIIWATDNGAKVINMSLGNYADAQFLHDAVKYAYERDVVLIAASGNDNTDQPGYPAAYPEVFAIGATDTTQNRAAFSNYGDYIDAAAPGVSIASTYPQNQYAALSGTSMASPHAAALAGLIRAYNPLLKNTEVMDIMRNTAMDLGEHGKDAYFGYGQIDVAQALNKVNRMNESVIYYTEWIRRQVENIRLKYEGM